MEHHNVSSNLKLLHKAWEPKNVSSLFNYIAPTNVLLLFKYANSNGTSSLETTPCVSTKSSYVDATTCVNSKAPYEKQPSTMESQAHSRKTLVELVKETQKVHLIHVINVEN
jgi:hypothetical protein